MLVFENDKLVPKEYTDLDFQFDKDSHQFTLGFVFTFGGATISWRSVK